MDKLTELKEKLADAYVKRQGTHDTPEITKHDFIKGFDAAMELQLPVYFHDWKQNMSSLAKDNFKHFTTEELYKHWIKNIYQTEK